MGGKRKAPEGILGLHADAEELMGASELPSMILDLNQRIVAVNRATSKVLGKPASELIGKQCYTVFHIKGAPKNCPFIKMLKTGKQETAAVSADALGMELSVGVTPLRGSTGKVVGALHTVMDLTERKKAEELLRGSEERYRQLVESSRDGIFTINSKMNVDWANDYAIGLFGYDKGDMPVRLTKLIPVEYLPATLKLFYEGLKGKTVLEPFDLEVRTKSGERIPVSYKGVLLHDAKGNVTGVLGIIRDIRERKKAERMAQDYKAKLEKQVKERTAELEERNRQLEEFREFAIAREKELQEARAKLEKLEKKANGI